jgi:hypothetical protein
MQKNETRMKRMALFMYTVFFVLPLCGQNVELKTNLLYLATTTPNMGVEWKLDRKYTATLTAAYNPFHFRQYLNPKGNTVNPKLLHWMMAGEVRYWFCESFLGWNMGVNVFGGEYNIGGIKFINKLEKQRYKGWGAGAGLTVGYQLPLSVRWSLDMSAGVGYAYTRYTKYDCYACGYKIGENKKNYWGPTKVAVSLVYLIK